MKGTDITAADLMEWSNGKIDKLRLPLPTKPTFPSPEFDFPDDPEHLSNTALGQLMLRMSAFYGYCQRLLGQVDAELSVVEAEYRLKINTASITIREGMSGRPAAEVVEAAVLADNEDLTPLYKRKLELSTIKIQLESRLKIYEKLNASLSRELSRREMETRIV